MLEQIKCECGHVNPIGTIFCEACGKPFENKEDTRLLDMRYEGSARRSLTHTRTIVDKVWSFFSSVKVGVWLIVITLLASAVGTIFPQEMYIPPGVTPSEYYEQEYGFLGQLYYQLGFNKLYSSWWYIILIASIGVSLVICSLDRVIPLYKALKKQGVKRHPSFLKRQRLYGTGSPKEGDLEQIQANLKKKNYTVRVEGENILAEKGRFSRWGPYVNHIGLIIFLFGAMLRFLPSMYVDEALWLRDGETKEIPGTDGKYYLKNEKFIKEVYDKSKDDKVFNDAIERVGDKMIAKNYQTNAVLYKAVEENIAGQKPKLEKVKESKIKVNEPLKFDQFALYQLDFKENEFGSMSFSLQKKDNQQKWKPIKVNLENPKETYDLGDGYSIKLLSYFPDFYFDENGQPNTKTKIPNNPAFVFKMFTPETPEGEVSFVGIQQNIEPEGNNQYKMTFAGVEMRNATGLIVRKDLTLWILGIGGFIFMVGVIQGMYWNHRRIWIQRVKGEWWIAGHTNKNWFGLRKDIEKVLEGTTIPQPYDKVNDQKIS
ncbi:cytochrome c biogenesis protein ResB [Bacillus pseudomycoides]|uniref:Cytochrome C biogenesis protein n=1 Tax=Bacillus pseudomycoides TaxID=64104 RepID=A0A2A8BYQ5_9BACI|nr:cytochrome c biogenesis protein ResB [Bacillus pseudomycoides]PDY45901.1 cytochrome C biogenesis protein [Bacillus pseudomycoides]PEA84886.1 cytochrome C biogenesis protein [Bacillus pseudomycoides]PED08107.1 cytochrome C biogenesis protein [Bacillus pseudomycoides]PEJ00100.1 cytochrome C biogenesis protein [Bacillus pseudomycoides]PEK18882.1 cytochrome C biogenesis protein [Bacillus pseudomycoides]